MIDIRRVIFLVGLVLAANLTSWAQQPATKPPSHKFTKILTSAGGAGGFVLGTFAGLAAFDDDIDSDRKVWTLAAISAGGGAVGGYFAGRAIDRRHDRSARDSRFNLYPVVSRDTMALHVSFGF